MTDHTTTDSMSRRNVLKATGGLLAGATMLAGSGAAATEAEPEPQFEIEDANEEVIVARVRYPDFPIMDNLDTLYLGLADDFIVHEDSVSLPENTEGLAQPVEVERLDEQTYRMYFRTGDIDFSEVEGEEVTLGLGVFPERTVSQEYWDTVSQRYNPENGTNGAY
jgi:hypothetical protein